MARRDAAGPPSSDATSSHGSHLDSDFRPHVDAGRVHIGAADRISAYLHEDFLEEYDTPAAAVRAFLEDADAGERARFRKEAKQFLAVTAEYDLPKLRTLLSRLGSRWTPPSRDAVIAVLSETQS